MGIKVGIVAESAPGERRVAMVPGALSVLNKTGAEFLLEAGAGAPAGFPDAEYTAKGVRIAGREEIFRERRGRAAGARSGRQSGDRRARCGADAARADRDRVRRAADVARRGARAGDRGVSFLAMELMPRITRAQSMDALSSMATIAGYKAVLIAADTLPRMFPMLMTAAGTVAPARVR